MFMGVYILIMKLCTCKSKTSKSSPGLPAAGPLEHCLALALGVWRAARVADPAGGHPPAPLGVTPLPMQQHMDPAAAVGASRHAEATPDQRVGRAPRDGIFSEMTDSREQQRGTWLRLMRHVDVQRGGTALYLRVAVEAPGWTAAAAGGCAPPPNLTPRAHPSPRHLNPSYSLSPGALLAGMPCPGTAGIGSLRLQLEVRLSDMQRPVPPPYPAEGAPLAGNAQCAAPAGRNCLYLAVDLGRAVGRSPSGHSVILAQTSFRAGVPWVGYRTENGATATAEQSQTDVSLCAPTHPRPARPLPRALPRCMPASHSRCLARRQGRAPDAVLRDAPAERRMATTHGPAGLVRPGGAAGRAGSR
jgi:hypothetical protein